MTKKIGKTPLIVVRWIIAIAGIAYVVDKLSWREIATMVHQADSTYLVASVLIYPMTFLITGIRWHCLIQALGIRISFVRAFILNMVGAFYNTFMPGSTGGDLLKAYYASKFTTLRTHAVMSVIVDRVIGLIALIILGGVMAGYQHEIPQCRQIAIICALIILTVIVALTIFYNSTLRRITGLDFIIKRLPMQQQVQTAIEAIELYRRRPWLVLGAVVMTFPVHITVILSAMLVGIAFNLPLPLMYYWAAVPVIVLVGSIPISPQGAGVMEFSALQLTKAQGASAGEAFALTMAIRLIQIFWNLTGAVFVFRGNYHAPTEREQAELDSDNSSRPVVSVNVR